ncbi:MAG: hypothetical protein HZY76_00540 [Anaerolineae bacterium]|nr:MAG: hypothetical protein HZY76_00540 [Anaerolineae bacterium]
MSVNVMSDDRMQTTGATRSAAVTAPDRAALRARLEETRGFPPPAGGLDRRAMARQAPPPTGPGARCWFT